MVKKNQLYFPEKMREIETRFIPVKKRKGKEKEKERNISPIRTEKKNESIGEKGFLSFTYIFGKKVKLRLV